MSLQQAEKNLRETFPEINKAEEDIKESEKHIVQILQRQYFVVRPDHKPKKDENADVPQSNENHKTTTTTTTTTATTTTTTTTTTTEKSEIAVEPTTQEESKGERANASQASKNKPEEIRIAEEFVQTLSTYIKTGHVWLGLLKNQQSRIQDVRLAACEEKASKTAESLHHMTRLIHLFQTTLRNSSPNENSNVRWEKLLATFESSVFLNQNSDFEKKEIGKSQFATVFEAKYEGVPVAAKIVEPTFNSEIAFLKANTYNEFFRLKQITAPPLLRYVAISTDGKVIVYELAKRGSIEDKTSTIPVDRKVKIARGVAVALYNLHNYEKKDAKEVLHRRLKPSNVMLTSDFQVKLADFGRPPVAAEEMLFKGGYAPYMAPELFDNPTGHTAETDIYAYGMVLYYLFWNKHPFNQHNSYADIKAQAQSDKNNVTHDLENEKEEKIPKSLKELIKRCIDKDPKKRHPFSVILKQAKPSVFDEIAVECTELFAGDAKDIWTSNEKMDWRYFVFQWSKLFSKVSDSQELMLRALMDVPMDGEDVTVKKDKFELFLKWFGPVKKETLSDFWKVISSLLQSKWFYGCMTAEDAIKRLRDEGDSKYLVRLYTGEKEPKPEPFILVYRKDKTTFECPFELKITANPEEELNKEFKKWGKNPNQFNHCTKERPIKFLKPFVEYNKGRGYEVKNLELIAM